ncbi:hypothetical protein CDD80_5963 [Ophiocordyceps camponoti-rufipedis]|uniref:Transcription factor CBF/NF-Y/archaeal histone domain-containing protein n=1 Tax=Ophiocordyceps camponoti-rufipedis TaxID=2004952 RepID=A0A2C5XXA2_9HYPO|nr:hypothetical protein CDD80_5963 [Ophiocordyceps camponoti-rufipedis]
MSRICIRLLCYNSVDRERQQSFDHQPQARSLHLPILKMALGKSTYPKATLKKIVKAHSGLNLKKNADVTIFLDYVLFMEKYDRGPTS